MGGTMGRMADVPSNRRKERQPCVSAKAARQWGNITAIQLADCDVSRAVISRWVVEGRLERILRGVYSVGPRSPAPEAFWAALLLAYGERSVLTRYTSIALHGLGKPPKLATVAAPKQARKQRGVEPHLSMPFQRDEVVIRRGLRTTSIERTLLDLAAIGQPVERLVAEAVAKRLTSIAKLRAYVERRSGARGVARLRRCIEGKQMRSLAEREFAAWLAARGLPEPCFNEPFGPYTLDVFWPEARLVVEVDPFETHGTAHPFQADRLKDAYTAARGLRTIRATPERWRGDAHGLEHDIRRALAHG